MKNSTVDCSIGPNADRAITDDDQMKSIVFLLRATREPILTEDPERAGLAHNKLKLGCVACVLKHSIFGWISSEGEIKKPA